MKYLTLLLFPLLVILLLSGCANGWGGIGIGLGYTSPDGTKIEGNIHLDPSFAKEKK